MADPRLRPDRTHPTRSYLLRNDGGTFTDLTAEIAPHLIEPGGMISDARWMDFDGDGDEDLAVALDKPSANAARVAVVRAIKRLAAELQQR